MGKQTTGSPLLLISDLDDTIKISHTQSKIKTVFRGLFRTSAFAGMPELYQEILAAHPGSQFHLVSSSPPVIQKKIEFFLEKNKFPAATILLRDWIRQPSTLKYKMKAILRLVESTSMPVILVGDDTEHDPEVFAHVQKKFPDKILARYVRIVTGRELPEGSTGFFTAFDLACAELAAKRLSSEQALSVGNALLHAKKLSRLIPKFSLKPPRSFVPPFLQKEGAVFDLWKKIQKKIDSIPRRKVKP